MQNSSRIIGRRGRRGVTFHASGALLEDGARFNDEIHRLPSGQSTGFRKGVYFFRTHSEANRHQEDCIIFVMVHAASPDGK
jgi:hypothetical protein